MAACTPGTSSQRSRSHSHQREVGDVAEESGEEGADQEEADEAYGSMLMDVSSSSSSGAGLPRKGRRTSAEQTTCTWLLLLLLPARSAASSPSSSPLAGCATYSVPEHCSVV